MIFVYGIKMKMIGNWVIFLIKNSKCYQFLGTSKMFAITKQELCAVSYLICIRASKLFA